MSDFVTFLVDMGFSQKKAEKAVKVTGNRGVEPALEWLESHANDDDESESETTEASNKNSDGDQAGGEEEAKSYKCEDCGKLFRNVAQMEFHAAKTKHSNFSESTEEKRELTAEEKAEQLKKIEEKIRIKRLEREEEEKKEALERERIRVKQGKEMLEAKRRFEEQEMKEIAEQRRREKIEERQARERVKAQIEADKLARKAKYGGGGGSQAEVAPAPPVASAVSSTSSVPDPDAPKKEYTDTKIQIRLPSGKSMVQTFSINETLAAVRLYVDMNRDDGLQGMPFRLMTNFPRKIFSDEEYDAPLSKLGLVPSAVLMVTKGI